MEIREALNKINTPTKQFYGTEQGKELISQILVLLDEKEEQLTHGQHHYIKNVINRAEDEYKWCCRKKKGYTHNRAIKDYSEQVVRRLYNIKKSLTDGIDKGEI